MKRPLTLALASLLPALLASGAHARPDDPAPAPSASAPHDAGLASRRAEARALFERGLAVLETDDVERALELFTRSRALFANKANTQNAALCLDRLGRFDEALELYEELLATFGRSLDNEDRAATATALTALRPKVGGLLVSANVSGTVVVDGRERGKLPLPGPIRLLPGPHQVRILKDGYRSADLDAVVVVGATVRLDAQLSPLEAAGGLRVEDSDGPDAEVFVDAIAVGRTPWEGTLAPGPHVVAIRRGASGSMPTQAQVLQGQTALVRLTPRPLGPTLRITTTPETAEIRLGDVVLGKGRWVGALPAGLHTLRAADEGYHEASRTITSAAGAEGPVELKLPLEVDRNHPRWPRPATGKLLVGATVGYGLGASFGGGLADSCASAPCSKGPVIGPSATLRVAYELPFRLSIEAAAGALSLSQTASREVPRRGQVGENAGISYKLEDLVRLKGYLVALGVGYAHPLSRSLSARARLLGGVVFASSSDTITGVVQSQGATESASLDGAGATERSTPPFVLPELALLTTVAGFELGLSLSALVTLSAGPSLPLGAIRVTSACPEGSRTAPGCVPDSRQLDGERAYGPFLLLMPQLSLSHQL